MDKIDIVASIGIAKGMFIKPTELSISPPYLIKDDSFLA